LAEQPTPEQLKDKLLRALKAKAVLSEKSRLLEQQVDDSRRREEMHGHFISELLDRQRETNFMLHRANSVLHRLQETNVALSSEFTNLVKELPAPNSPDWEQRVAKINDLFRKTGELAEQVQDEVFKKGAPVDNALIQSEPKEKPAPVAPQAPAEPVAVPVRPEPVFEAEPVAPEAQPVFQAAEAETVDAEFTTHDASVSEPKRDERLERLFRRLETVEPEHGAPVQLVDLDQPKDSKPGRKSGLWGRITRRSRREQSVGPDAEDSESHSEMGKAS
jgi:hypothetical protein